MGRARGRRRLAVASAVVVLLVGVGAAGLVASRGSGSRAQAAKLVTAVVRRGDLTQTVDAPFTLALQTTATLVAPATAAGASGTPVLSQLSIGAGEALPTLQPIMQVDGAPIFGISSPVPLYRNLAEGDTGPDVQVVQFLLTGAGYATGGVDGTFGAATAAAVDAFQAAQGVAQTGAVSLDQFVSYSPGSVVLDLKAAVGGRVPPGTLIADLAVPGSLAAQADVSQSDFTRVRAGQAAQLSFDAFPGVTEQGLVATLPLQAEAQQSAGAGSSAPVDFAVTIAPAALPGGARAGMTGQVSIVVTSRSNVVIVPTAAVGGSGDNPTVQLVESGKVVTKRVVVGLATANETEIIAGVRPGDTVVVGTSAPASASTTAPTGIPGLGGIRGGGRGGGGGRGIPGD